MTYFFAPQVNEKESKSDKHKNEKQASFLTHT